MSLITLPELQARLETNPELVLVEALPPQYFRHSHLPGAINIPLDEIGTAEKEIPDRDAEIIVYCMDPP